MPVIKPFKGILYNPSRINNISKVVSLPYDILSKADQKHLYDSSPHNIIRLILGRKFSSDTKNRNRYTRARGFLLSWIKDGTLKQDDVSAIYLYEQGYLHEGRHIKRIGFVGALKLEELGEHYIFPHEETFAGPKLDRLNLIKTVRANLSPIFCIFQDKPNATDSIFENYIKRHRPIVDIKYKGVSERLWRITDEAIIKKISAIMREKKIFIADGHHRYEASLNYMKLCKKKSSCKTDAPCNYIMTFFLNTEAPTPPTILAAHRILERIGMKPDEFLKSLSEFFLVSKSKGKNEVAFKLKKNTGKKGCFGLFLKGAGWYSLEMRNNKKSEVVMNHAGMPRLWAGLDVAILRRIIFDKVLKLKASSVIEYTTDIEDGVKRVSSGKFDVLFILNPTQMSQVCSIAEAGLKMPHKSTYFYPKLLDGLVINKLW